MGLDNGIVVKNIKRKDIPSFVVPYYFDKEYTDLVYYRKCYNIRNEFLNVLHGEVQGRTPIEAEDIPALLKKLYYYCSKEHWEEDDYGSMWAFEDIIDHHIQNIINLKWLYSYMIEHPEVEAFFYDSY